MPCAAVAQEVAGAKEGTREGELVAAIGVVTSVLINIPAILIGALFINYIQQYFPAWLLNAFNKFLLRAVFGAVWGQSILRGWKYLPIVVLLAYIPMALKVPAAWNIRHRRPRHNDRRWAMLRYFKIKA